MANIHGVYHPVDDDEYRLTGTSAGSGDLGQLAATAAAKATDAAAEAAALAIEEAVDQAKAYTDEMFHLPQLTNTNLDTLTGPMGGTGSWRASSTNGVTGYPPEHDGINAFFIGYRFTTQHGIQYWMTAPIDGVVQVWQRRQDAGTWSAWTRVDPDALKEYADNSQHIPTLYDADLDTMTGPAGGTGRWRASSLNGVTGFPPELTGSAALLEAYRFTSQSGFQRWITPPINGRMQHWQRIQDGGVWSPWVRESAAQAGSGVGGEARTPVEVLGEWTSVSEAYDYEDALAQHQAVTLLHLGTSVEGNPIRAFRLGDPSKPAVLFTAGQHGDEMGPPEGALIFARELAMAETFVNYDLCTIIVPRLNPDRWDQTRNNANGVNLNRDWANRTQPETQAAMSLFTSHNIIAAVDAHSFGYPTQVSLRAAGRPDRVDPVVEALSEDLYAATFSAYEDGGHSVRQYEHENIDGMAHLEWSALERTTSLLIEIPSHRGYTTVWNPYYSPNPHWQARMACLGYHAVLDHVWRNKADYIAAKAA